MGTPPPPPPAPPPPSRGGRGAIPVGARLLIAGVVLLLALPVAFGLYFFGIIAVLGCFGDCSDPDPNPLLGALLVLTSAALAGAGVGLIPWALHRRDLIRRTAVIVAVLVLLVFGLSVLDGG